MKLADDKRGKWLVQAGDPAAKHRNLLVKRGFDYIVLPRTTYLTGEVPEEYNEETGELGLIDSTRLQDCLLVLNGKV